jgi:hypothetical protein
MYFVFILDNKYYLSQSLCFKWVNCHFYNHILNKGLLYDYAEGELKSHTTSFGKSYIKNVEVILI